MLQKSFVLDTPVKRVEFAVWEDHTLAVTLPAARDLTLVFRDTIRQGGKRYYLFHEKTQAYACDHTVTIRTAAVEKESGAPIRGLLVTYSFRFDPELRAFHLCVGYNADLRCSGYTLRLMDVSWEGMTVDTITGYERDAQGNPFSHTFRMPEEENPEAPDYETLMKIRPHVAWERMKTRPVTFQKTVAVQGKDGYFAICGGTPTFHYEAKYVQVFSEIASFTGDLRYLSGSNSPGAWFLLDMKRMNKLISIDENAHSITAEAGMIFQQLEWYANEKGFSCMHIPSCLTCGTIGGALGHRGIGIFSSKYGKIDDQCMSMEVVLPNGDIINTLPVPKHAAGPDLNQIFIGSEGTLGIITKATFRLFEQPKYMKHHAFLFKSMGDGLRAGRDIMQKCQPSIMRLFDEAETVSIIKKIIGFEKKGSFLNLSVDGADERLVDIQMEIIKEICESYGAEDMGSEYGEKWYENRITFFYPDHIMDIPQMFGTMDTVADFSHMEEIYWAMKNAIESNYPGVRFIAHCSHWYGWGTMLYDRFIMDNPPEDKEEALRLHNQIWNTGVRAAMEHGGVINDHHGIGLKLSRLMKEQYGPAFQVMEGLKKSLDPNGIMNPYKLGL